MHCGEAVVAGTFILSVCMNVFAVTEERSHPLILIGRMVNGKEDLLGCDELRAVWVALVFLALMALVVTALAFVPTHDGFPRSFGSSWPGLGEDVGTAGVIEAVLRLGFPLAVLLGCAGLAYGMAAKGEAAREACRFREPPGPLDQVALIGGRVGLAASATWQDIVFGGLRDLQNTIAQATTAAMAKASDPVPVRLHEAPFYAFALGGIESGSGAIAMPPASAPPARPVELRGVEDRLSDLVAAVRTQAPPPSQLADLRIVEEQLAEVVALLKTRPPTMVTTQADRNVGAPANLSGISATLADLAATLKMQKPPVVNVAACGVRVMTPVQRANARHVRTVAAPAQVPQQCRAATAPLQ